MLFVSGGVVVVFGADRGSRSGGAEAARGLGHHARGDRLLPHHRRGDGHSGEEEMDTTTARHRTKETAFSPVGDAETRE